MKKISTAMLSAAAVLATSLAFVPGAQAAGPESDRAMTAVRELPLTLRTVDPTSKTGWVGGGRGVATSADGGTSMRLVTTRGNIVDSTSASEKVVRGSGVDSDSVVQRTADGGRIIEVLHSKDAPSDFSYEMVVPQGQKLTQLANGAIMIGAETRFGDEVTVEVSGMLTPAWARDTNGKPIPAHYTVENTRVTMHVDQSNIPKSSYPIVADPTLSAGGWQASYSIFSPSSVTVKANKKRSAQIAGDEGNLACIAMTLIPVVGVVLAALCFLDIYLMKKIFKRGYCVGQNSNILTRSHQVFFYKGGFCT